MGEQNDTFSTPHLTPVKKFRPEEAESPFRNLNFSFQNNNIGPSKNINPNDSFFPASSGTPLHPDISFSQENWADHINEHSRIHLDLSHHYNENHNHNNNNLNYIQPQDVFNESTRHQESPHNRQHPQNDVSSQKRDQVNFHERTPTTKENTSPEQFDQRDPRGMNSNQKNDNQTKSVQKSQPNSGGTNLNQIDSNRTNFNQTNLNQIDSNQTNFNQTNLNQMDSNQTNFNQTNSNQMDSNQTNFNQTTNTTQVESNSEENNNQVEIQERKDNTSPIIIKNETSPNNEPHSEEASPQNKKEMEFSDQNDEFSSTDLPDKIEDEMAYQTGIIQISNLLPFTQKLLSNPIIGYTPRFGNLVVPTPKFEQKKKTAKRKINWIPANLLKSITETGQTMMNHHNWICIGKRKNKLYWKCVTKGCPVRKFKLDDEEPQATGEHNHAPEYRYPRFLVKREESLKEKYEAVASNHEKKEDNPLDILEFEIPLDVNDSLPSDCFSWRRCESLKETREEKAKKKQVMLKDEIDEIPDTEESLTYWKCTSLDCHVRKAIEIQIETEPKEAPPPSLQEQFQVVHHLPQNEVSFSSSNQKNYSGLSLQEMYNAQVSEELYQMDDQVESFEEDSGPVGSNAHSLPENTNNQHFTLPLDLPQGTNTNNIADQPTFVPKKKCIMTYFGLHNHQPK